MLISRGFTLLESLMTIVVLGLLISMAGLYWSWDSPGTKEKAYVKALEDVLLRARHSADVMEQPIAVCFALSERCMAEGVLVPRDAESIVERTQTWQLLEAMPVKENILIGTNFTEQQLVIQTGGQNVRQPGTIHICSANETLPYAWRIVVARSGRVTTTRLTLEAVEAQNIARLCRNID